MKREPLIVHCAKCEHEWAPCFLPLDMGVMSAVLIRSSRQGCPACGHRRALMGPVPRPTNDGDATGWLQNGDTGVSSETIWRVLMGETPRHAGIPYDPDDFGRCYRLLKVMPSWRARLGEVAAKYPEWQSLVDAWDELTALYEEELPSGQCTKLWKRMSAMRRERV